MSGTPADDQKSPWTIKGMRVTDRQLAVDLAQKADLTIAELMAEALQLYASRAAGNAVLPPQRAVVGAPMSPAVDRQVLLLDHQAQALAAVTQAMGILPGRNGAPARRAARELCLNIEADLRGLRGLPRVQPSRAPQITGST